MSLNWRKPRFDVPRSNEPTLSLNPYLLAALNDCAGAQELPADNCMDQDSLSIKIYLLLGIQIVSAVTALHVHPQIEFAVVAACAMLLLATSFFLERRFVMVPAPWEYLLRAALASLLFGGIAGELLHAGFIQLMRTDVSAWWLPLTAGFLIPLIWIGTLGDVVQLKSRWNRLPWCCEWRIACALTVGPWFSPLTVLRLTVLAALTIRNRGAF